MARTLVLVQGAHLGSQRVPNKLLERIGDRTLLEIGLDKLRTLQKATGIECVISCCPEEEDLYALVKSSGLSIIALSKEEVTSPVYEVAWGQYPKYLARFDWTIQTNFLCRPFLELQTMETLCRAAQTTPEPFAATIEERGLIWNDQGEMLIGIGETADTKKNPKYHRLAHLGYAFPVDLFDKEEELSAVARPYPIPLMPWECIDIDWPHDLMFARMVAPNLSVEKLRQQGTALARAVV